MIGVKKLLKNGTVVNVFTGELQRENVLIENGIIIGTGSYGDDEADETDDLTGKYICPGFIDGHIHIESTMLMPSELARVCLPHGTTRIVADPHEIANVCGVSGIEFMLSASENLPFDVNIMLPSCVPATPFDESGAVLSAEDLKQFYSEKRVLGLAEMMNYPGVVFGDADIAQKIADAREYNRVVDGHAPMITGKNLDKYISAGIQSDHECSSFEEGAERIRKGQWLMIRQGTAAKNLKELLPLFEEPYCRRCLLVTDDKHPHDLLNGGHIDGIIREAVSMGKSVVTAIQMATIQAAQCFGIKYAGAVAPGYKADLAILDNLENVSVCDVYFEGKKVVNNKKTVQFKAPEINADLMYKVKNSFNLKPLSANDFCIEEKGQKCRVIKIIPNQILTDEIVEKIDWSKNGGIDVERDILKLAVIERHHGTGHIGLGFVKGTGLKNGAIASSVSHDSHNLIVIGTNNSDMALAANHIHKIGGGNAVVSNGKVVADMALPIAGLMTDIKAEKIAEKNFQVRDAVHKLGVFPEIEPFMNMAFVSLPVIPNLKMATTGLVDVNEFKHVSLYAD